MWLHVATSPASLTASLSTFPDMLSIVKDPDFCSDAAFPNTCVYGTGPYYPTRFVNESDPPALLGEMVARNSSTEFQVVTLDSELGPIAVITVPQSKISHSSAFKAKTIGMEAWCDRNDSCLAHYHTPTDIVVICNVSGVTPTLFNPQIRAGITNITFPLNLSNIPWDLAHRVDTYPLQEASHTVSTAFDGLGHGVTNPFGFALSVVYGHFSTLSDHSLDSFRDTTTYAATCRIYVYDVILAFTNGVYSIDTQSLADENATMWLFQAFLGDGFAAVMDQAMSHRIVDNLRLHLDDADLTPALNTEVRQIPLAYAITLFKLAPTNVTTLAPFIGSRYPVSALACLWSSAALYALISVLLLLDAATLTGDVVPLKPLDEEPIQRKYTSTLHLAHQRLVSPIAIVAEHFVLSAKSDCHPGDTSDEAALSVQGDVIAMFPDSRTSTQRRLRVGFVSEGDGLQDEEAHTLLEKRPMTFKIV
jgi:hypothetical protein